MKESGEEYMRGLQFKEAKEICKNIKHYSLKNKI